MGTHHKACPLFNGGLSQHNRSCLDAATGGNLMHKMNNATMHIIEAMASHGYNGTSDKRILMRPREFTRWRSIHPAHLLTKSWIFSLSR